MKICMAGRRQPINVQWQESGAAAGYWSDSRKKSFLDQLSACGIEPTENADVAMMRVSAEVTPSRLLLVAEAGDANGRQIRMVEVPRTPSLTSRANGSAPHLTGELLWQQERPISSAMVWQDPASPDRYFFLLGDGSFIRLRSDNGSWHVMDSAALPERRHSRFADAEFAYALTGRPFEFLLDGNVCAFPPAGALFFSCTEQTPVRRPLRLFSKCEQQPRYLLAGNGDFTQPDQVLLGAPARDAASVPTKEGDASAVAMPGPVLGLSLGENGTEAFAVVRNLSTGNYEVYRITAVCGD